MSQSFTTYTDALNAVYMVENFALRMGMRIPQHTICYHNDMYYVTRD